MRLLACAALLLSAGTAQAAAPDLAACPRPESPEGGERTRTKPLPVPKALRGIVRSSLYHYAVATRGGGTVCIDTSWMDVAENIELSPDGRFFSFSWLGWEIYGHRLVDRAGKGDEIETGAKPVFSPSGRRLAAVDTTEAESSSLQGFAVWEIEAEGLREMTRMTSIPGAGAWRIDRWAGESCIELVAEGLHQPGEPIQGDTRFAAWLPNETDWLMAPAPKGCAAR